MLKGKAARHTSSNQADEHRPRGDEAGQRLPGGLTETGRRLTGADHGLVWTGQADTESPRPSLGFLPLTSAPHLVATPH